MARVSPAVKHGAPPPEAWATLCCCGSGGGRAGESIQFPLLFLSESLPRRFQCDASSVGSENCRLSTGSPSLWLGYHPRLSMVRLRRRRELLCVVVGAEVGEQERVYSFHFYSCPSLSLDAFSATPPASEVRTVVCPRVPPRSARVSPAVKHSAPPPEA